MDLVPPLDVVSGAVILGTLAVGLIILLAVMLLEGFVLRLLGWARLGRSLADSVIANVISAGPGVLLAILLPAIPDMIFGATVVPLLVGSFLFSTVIEVAAIILIRRRPAREVLFPFLAANAASHISILTLFVATRSAGG
jgi:hypothetical protein